MENPLPERVAQHDERRTVRNVFGARELAAILRAYPEDAEVSGRNPLLLHELEPALAREINARNARPSRHVERPDIGPHRFEDRAVWRVVDVLGPVLACDRGHQAE